jgi:hypothetical protein
MAIKVNGTTVIDDSRNLSNVGGLKTVNGTSIVGSGNISAGASTTYGAVGTYGYFLYIINGTSTINTRLTVNQNITTSGSNLRGNAANTSVEYGDQNGYQRLNGVSFNGGGSALSGTWRCMGKATYFINHNRGSGNYAAIWTPLLWVRIS